MKDKKSKVGRKALKEKKEGITIYDYPSEMRKYGGRDKVRAFLNAAWELEKSKP